MAHRPPLPRTARPAPRPARRPPGATAVVTLLLVLVVSVLAACSGGADTASDDSGGADGAETQAERPNGVSADLEGLRGSARDAVEARRAAPMTRQVIRTGEVTLQAEDVTGLRDEVDGLVQRYGGYISSERSFTDDKGRLVEDRLVLRVPSSRYDRVMSGFAEVATVLAPSTKSEDVTTEVIDVDSRVRTAEVSLDRLRNFLQRSVDVDAMIRLESEIAEREAELASLRAQQDYLEDQTSLATISVTLQRPPEDEPRDPSGDDGFLAGLSGGWDALKAVVVVAATILGAMIPFALVAALLGVPLLLVLRATRRRRPVVPPPATASQGMPAS